MLFRSVNRKAIFSLGYAVAAFGIAVFLVPFVGFLVAVPAVTCGVHARREIAESGGTERGADLALYGLAVAASTILIVVATYIGVAIGG